MSIEPYPHDIIIGGRYEEWHDHGGWETTYWAARFEREPNGWACIWRLGPEDEAPEIDSLKGHGASPKEAFDSLVRIYTFTNGGQESTALRNILQAGLRDYFKDDGDLHSPEVIARMLKEREQ